MAERNFDRPGFVLLDAPTERDFVPIVRSLVLAEVDFRPLNDETGSVPAIRNRSQSVDDPADSKWVDAVQTMFGHMEAVELAIQNARLTDYVLRKIKAVTPNPNFTITGDRDVTENRVKVYDRQGLRKYHEMSQAALIEQVDPLRQDKFPRDLSKLAVLMSFRDA